MRHCKTCGGTKLEPNKNYRYAGPVCYCGSTQNDAGMPGNTFDAQSARKAANAELEVSKLKEENSKLRAKLAALKNRHEHNSGCYAVDDDLEHTPICGR